MKSYLRRGHPLDLISDLTSVIRNQHMACLSLSHHYTTVPGLAVTPIGLRMLWRNGKVWKPYFTVKGGVVAYTQKALSRDGAYLNFTLQTAVGMELRLTHAWEIRLGAGDFHFSNARQVPSNPGIDEMMYTVGLSYHLHSRRTAD